jgi:hypothetical protein
MCLSKALLKRVKLARIRGQPLHREELMLVRLHGQQEAGTHRLAIEEYRAGAAGPLLAAHMGAAEAELVAEEIAQ